MESGPTKHSKTGIGPSVGKEWTSIYELFRILCLVTKGSVSYLSSPCFSTIIGGIGGPARGKRRLLDVSYVLDINYKGGWCWLRLYTLQGRHFEPFAFGYIGCFPLCGLDYKVYITYIFTRSDMIIFFFMTGSIRHSFNGNIWIARMLCWSGTLRAGLGHGGIEVWAICQDTKWPARLQIPRAAWIEPGKLPNCAYNRNQHDMWRLRSFQTFWIILIFSNYIFKYVSWFSKMFDLLSC